MSGDAESTCRVSDSTVNVGVVGLLKDDVGECQRVVVFVSYPSCNGLSINIQHTDCRKQ